ncbi:MAG TPA: hypothetical protein VGD58_14000 [Herpetosiphonaceae bacterium]
MSQTLLVELSDEMYAAIERQAAEEQISPAQVVASSLEQHFRQERGAPKRIQRSEAELQAARERFERLIGAVDLGHPTGADNDSIDADLSRHYADTNEEQ